MKKLLNTLYITNELAYLSLEGENIVCKLEDSQKFRVPFTNLENIIMFNYNGASPALLGKCVSSGVPITFISPSGKFLARVIGESRGNVILRKQQINVFDEGDLTIVKNLVASKICNTQYTIKRSLRDNEYINDDGKISQTVDKLNNIILSVYKANSKTEILGLEGSAAKLYFNIFNRLILQQKDEFYLLSRSKRPPLDKTNSVLSFMYTIWTSNYASALEGVGLDSYVGFYHELRSGRSSLACDLVEETRSIIDRFVLTLINLKVINESDFDKQISGAVFLNDDGKKKVLAKWEDKKRTKIVHPYLKQKIQLGLIPFVQSHLLAKYIRGEINEYPNYLLK